MNASLVAKHSDISVYPRKPPVNRDRAVPTAAGWAGICYLRSGIWNGIGRSSRASGRTRGGQIRRTLANQGHAEQQDQRHGDRYT